LGLPQVGMGDGGATAIAECRGLGNLWALALDGNPITDAGARALADSPHFPNLVSASHEDTNITRAGASALRAMLARNEAKLPEWTDGPGDSA
jgi:hypothetical protein